MPDFPANQQLQMVTIFTKIKPRVTPPQLSEESGSSHVQDIEFTRESFR
jgi:hypothetical protein